MTTKTDSADGSKCPRWKIGDEVCFRHSRAMKATVTGVRYDPDFHHQLVEIDLFPGEFASHLFVKWG